MSDKDAKACFDHMLPALSIITCRRLGLLDLAARFMYKLLQTMVFKVGTGCEISKKTYMGNKIKTTQDKPQIKAPGQLRQSEEGPSDVTLTPYKKYSVEATFQHLAKITARRTDQTTKLMDDVTLTSNFTRMEEKMSTNEVCKQQYKATEAGGSIMSEAMSDNSQ